MKGAFQTVGSTIFVTQGFGEVFANDDPFAWATYVGNARTPTFNEMRYSILSDAFAV